MANVMFKRGTQAKLSSLKSFVDGAFYLTTDTDRLYVAQSSTELVELNKSITIVDKVGDLPATTAATDTAIKGADVAVGQFYYVKAGAKSASGNVLAVCSAIDSTGAITWTQVNPDTNTNDVTRLTGVEVTAGTDKKTYTVKIKWTLNDKDQDPLTTKFTVDPTSIISIGLATEAMTVDKGAYIKTSGTGANTNKVAIVADGGGIAINRDEKTGNIKIKGTSADYSMALDGTATNKLVLHDGVAGSDKGSLTIAGSGIISAKGDTTTSTITISHGNSGVGKAATYGPTADAKPTAGNTFTVPSFTVNETGHITAAATRTITLPADTNDYVDSGTISRDKATNQVKIDLHRKGGGTVTIQDAPDADGKAAIHNTITVDGKSTVVNNGGNLGSFYSASKIDEKFRTLDAFTYKGTVGNSDTITTTVKQLPTTKVSNGDAYKVAVAGNYANADCKIGDILIAMGTEGADGYLTTVAWTKVQGTDEMDTTYTFTSDTNGIKLHASSGGDQIVNIVNGTSIGVDKTTANTIKINHANIGKADTYGDSRTAATSLKFGGKFTVPVITTDAQGHVSSARNLEFTLPADSNVNYTLVPDAENNLFNLHSSTGGDVSNVKYAGYVGTGETDKVVDLTLTKGEGANDIIVTAKHKDTYGAKNSSNQGNKALTYGGQFTVPYIVSDKYGHVTSISNHTMTLPASVDTKYKLSGSTTYKDNVGTFTTLLQTTEGGEMTGATHKIQSSTLTMSASGDTLTADLVWGTF